MSKATNQIGQELHAGGMTPSQSGSIARWLSSAAGVATSKPLREITAGDSRGKTTAFRNAFRPPEVGTAAISEQTGGGDGVSGSDGTDGSSGLPGWSEFPGASSSTTNYGNTAVLANVDLRGIFQQLAELWKRVSELMYLKPRVAVLERRVGGLEADLQNMRVLVERMDDDLARLKARVNGVEQDIRNAVECP